ncbi:MAG: thrombospondin type 3 repeat-containing protein [Roseibacillus sp.]
MEQQLPDKFRTSSARRRASILCAIALPACFAWADPCITDVSITATQVIVTFEEDGPNNQFEIQRNPDLDPNNWSTDLSATLSPPVSGVRTYTLSRNAADKEFFQIIGNFLGTGLDPDGDGLPTTFENTLGTDGTKFDTDGDGFNDGFEYASGTDPNDINSFPANSTGPRISFAETTHLVTEGDGVVNLQLETEPGSPPYTGPVTFTVLSFSTAIENTDYTLTSPSMSGTSGTFPVNLIDNGIISKRMRILSIQIENSVGNYARGSNFETSLIIDENDAFWSGVLKDGYCETSFRLRQVITNGVNQFAFVAGSVFDGLPANPDATVGSSDQSAGIIPIGQHIATSVTQTSSTFDLTSPLIPVARTSLFGEGLSLVRLLEFSAVGSAPDGLVTDLVIGGTYTETISDPSGENPHLNVNKTGTFAIARQGVLPPEISPTFTSN